MTGQPLTRSLTIVNRLGLHARAAGKLVNLAKTFSSDVLLSKNGETVDAKSIMKVMLLAAEVGSEVELSVEGDDAEVATREAARLENEFDTDAIKALIDNQGWEIPRS